MGAMIERQHLCVLPIWAPLHSHMHVHIASSCWHHLATLAYRLLPSKGRRRCLALGADSLGCQQASRPALKWGGHCSLDLSVIITAGGRTDAQAASCSPGARRMRARGLGQTEVCGCWCMYVTSVSPSIRCTISPPATTKGVYWTCTYSMPPAANNPAVKET